jgi:hypothetical protein
MARPALAQTGTAGTSGTSSFSSTDFFWGIQKTKDVNMSAYDLGRFFNKAACDCSTPTWIYVALTGSGIAKRSLAQNGTAEVRVGTSCDQQIYRNACTLLYSTSIATFLAQGRTTVETNARVLSHNATTTVDADGGVTTSTTADCESTISTGFNQTIWLLLDYGGDGTIDVPGITTQVHVDVTPPPAPGAVYVRGGNEALEVSWNAVDFSTNQDLQGYQVLCRRGAKDQVFKTGTFPAFFTSAASYDKAQCTTGTMGTGIEGLDPDFACSPLLNKSTTSYRVKILQNGITYAADVVAIDNNGNASQPVLHGQDPMFKNLPTNYAVPSATVDFYMAYRGGDAMSAGAAEGGFCAVGQDAPTRSRALGGGLVLIVGAVGLALARRRRRS